MPKKKKKEKEKEKKKEKEKALRNQGRDTTPSPWLAGNASSEVQRKLLTWQCLTEELC